MLVVQNYKHHRLAALQPFGVFRQICEDVASCLLPLPPAQCSLTNVLMQKLQFIALFT